jgi:hypothetical protein
MDESRLDAKIRRKHLTEEHKRFVDDRIDNTWEDLWIAVSQTANKLNQNYSAGLSLTRNDHKTVIKIDATLNAVSLGRPLMDITLDRGGAKVIMRYSARQDVIMWQDPKCFAVKADLETAQLYFEDSPDKRFTPIQLAEHLLAEKLLNMNLDSR